MQFLAKGKRGEVYTELYKGKRVAIKRERAGSTAINRLENEAYWLKKLNKKKIGPKFIKLEKGSLFMEYVQGEPVGEYLEKKKLSKALAKEILEQCRILDELQVNKLEMNHPTKHILIKKGKVSRKTIVMLDFERCKQTEKPKNVTQFCQYITKHNLKVDKKKLMQVLRDYKKDYSLLNFRRLLNLLFN